VVYVPALLGLGTPHWDYGARGALFGITRGTGRAEVVRAVLEGVAHRGVDLVEAVVADTGLDLPVLRIDGGMSVNPTFVQALADASGRPVEVSPHAEATTIGAAYLAGLAAGVWGSTDELAELWRPARVVEPRPGADNGRERWREAVSRARGWIPDLSALDF
jgi:glycerol kinase